MLDRTSCALWEFALPVYGLDPYYWRQDFRGRLILRGAYGRRFDQFGWEKGHIIAAADGGDDNLWNLQAEHWQTNLEKEYERQCRERERRQVDALLNRFANATREYYMPAPLDARRSYLPPFGGGLSTFQTYMPKLTALPQTDSELFRLSQQAPFGGGLRANYR